MTAKSNYVVHGQLAKTENMLHTHPVGQLLYAEKGLINIDYSDRKMLLPMHFCSWIPPFKPHRIWSAKPDTFVRAIYFDSSFCQNPVFGEAAVFSLSSTLREMIRYTAKWNGVAEDNQYETTFLTAIRHMLVDEVHQNVRLELPTTDSLRLQPILNFIAAHYADEPEARQLAQTFGLSARTLQRVFVKELGLSFSEYLMFYRLFRSVEMLLETDRPIKEVAYAVGYNSVPSFTKMFRTVTGLTPQLFAGKARKNL